MAMMAPQDAAKMAMAQKLEAAGKNTQMMAPKPGSGRYSPNDQFKKPMVMPMPDPRARFNKPGVVPPQPVGLPSKGPDIKQPIDTPSSSSDEAMKKIIAEKAAAGTGAGGTGAGAPSVGIEKPPKPQPTGPSTGPSTGPAVGISDPGKGFMSPYAGAEAPSVGPATAVPGMKRGGAVRKKPQTKFASGGSVGGASRRGDGIAQRGKTKGRMC